VTANQVYDLIMLGVVTPSAAIALIGVMAIARGWWIRAKEFRLQEKRIQMEERLRSDELGARILRSDDGVHISQIGDLTEAVRLLRQEVAELKQNLDSRVIG